MIFFNHWRVSSMVADDLAPIWWQNICNHHEDVAQSVHLWVLQPNVHHISIQIFNDALLSIMFRWGQFQCDIVPLRYSHYVYINKYLWAVIIWVFLLVILRQKLYYRHKVISRNEIQCCDLGGFSDGCISHGNRIPWEAFQLFIYDGQTHCLATLRISDHHNNKMHQVWLPLWLTCRMAQASFHIENVYHCSHQKTKSERKCST